MALYDMIAGFGPLGDLFGQTQQPTPPGFGGGFLRPRRYLGQDIPEDVALQARNRGLLSLGTSLLQAAPSADVGGALSGAVPAFLGGRNEALEGYLDESSRQRSLGTQERYAGMAEERFAREKAAQRRAQMESTMEKRKAERVLVEQEGYLDEILSAVPEEDRGRLRALYKLDPVAARKRYEELTGGPPDPRYFQHGRHVVQEREGEFEPAFSFPADDPAAPKPKEIRPNEYIDNYNTTWRRLYSQKKEEIESGLTITERHLDSEADRRARVHQEAASYADEETTRLLGQQYSEFGYEAPGRFPSGGGPDLPVGFLVQTTRQLLSRRPELTAAELRRLLAEDGVDPETIEEVLRQASGM